MGLDVTLMSVRKFLADDQRAREHNAFLTKTGFTMPSGSDEDFGFTEQVGPYAVYHHLWRYAAYLEIHGGPPPEPGTHPLDDPAYQEAMKRSETRFDQLLRHTEEGGYYYPLDFPKVISVAPIVESKGFLKKMFGGGSAAPAKEVAFGSAIRLNKELLAINEFLKVPVRDEAPSATYEDGIHGDEWGDEKWSWCVLYFMSRKAIEHGQIMVFE